MSVLWVVDTNVVISAILFGGRASALHAAWKAGKFSLAASSAIVAEYQRVLAYPKFRLSAEQAMAVYDSELRPFLTPIADDPDDDKFLWTAEAAGIDTLISGDPHLLALRPAWKSVSILTVAEAIARLEASPLA